MDAISVVSFSFFFAVGSSCADRKPCYRAGESGWCVFAFFFFFYMGLNHYIGSLLNYRPLSASLAASSCYFGGSVVFRNAVFCSFSWQMCSRFTVCIEDRLVSRYILASLCLFLFL